MLSTASASARPGVCTVHELFSQRTRTMQNRRSVLAARGMASAELLEALRELRAAEPFLGLKPLAARLREQMQKRPLPGVTEVREALREKEATYWMLLMAPRPGAGGGSRPGRWIRSYVTS